MLVDVTPELMEESVPTGTISDDGDTEYMSPPVWQTVLGSGLSVREEAAPGVDCYDSVVREPTSVCLDSAVGFVDLAGGITVRVTALAIAGVASLANAGVVSLADAGVASLADAGVAYLAVAGVAFLAIAGVTPLANLAEGVTIVVVPPALAGVTPLANAGVASLADAGVASLAVDGVASLAVDGVASLADAGVASLAVDGVASLVDSAEVVSSAHIAGSVAVCVTLVWLLRK